MSRRILVRITSEGVLSVRAEGFHGRGCEEATKSLEDALGPRIGRNLKPEWYETEAEAHQSQQLGDSPGGS